MQSNTLVQRFCSPGYVDAGRGHKQCDGMFDAALFQHVKDSLSSVWMDGCPSTQLAARTLAGDFFKTNCRLAGRDFCHEVMVDAKLPVKTEDMWADIHHHWFDKQYSFSKQSCYSDRAREVLLASHETVQRHWKEMSDNNMLNNQGVPGHLFFMQHEMSTSYTHAPQRFVSIAEPWQMICKDLIGNMFFLAN